MRVALTSTAILMFALTSGACGRINFDAQSTNTDATVDSGMVTIDSAPIDAMRFDAAPPIDISCTTPVPVSVTALGASTLEPAMRTDNLNLFARTGSTDMLASRANSSSAFSDWAISTNIQSIPEDPNFIGYEGAELAAGVRRPPGDGEPRHILLCNPPFDSLPCSRLSIFDSQGVPVTNDIDGPALAVREGTLVMAFTRSISLYVALPRDSELMEWDATLVDLGQAANDPAFTKGGGILIVPVDAGVVFMQWDSGSGSYLPPKLIPGLSGVAPDIGVESDRGFELFMTDNTRGVAETHRSDCSY